MTAVVNVVSKETKDTEKELKAYFEEAFLIQKAFNPGFTEVLHHFAGWCEEEMLIGPNSAGPGSPVLARLGTLQNLIQDEVERIQEIYKEFEVKRAEIKTRYSEQEARAWLEQNMPDRLRAFGPSNER